MKRSIALLLAIVAGGCGYTWSRPDQDNFTIHGSEQQVDKFVGALSKRFGATGDSATINDPDNDPNRMFRLEGAFGTLVLGQEADDRCDVNAPKHATFNQGEYRIDLVYGSKSSVERQSARRALVQAAQDAGLVITKYKECRYS